MYATTWADAYNVQSAGHVDELARVSVVTGNFFNVLGARIERALTAADDGPIGANPVAVISDAYWSRRFGSGIAGGRTLNSATFDIVGVASRGFSGDWLGWPTDIWIPEAMASAVFPESAAVQVRGLRRQHKLIARLAPGVTLRQAQTQASLFYHQLRPPTSGSAGRPGSMLPRRPPATRDSAKPPRNRSRS